MPQDRFGKEVEIEAGAPYEDRARHVRDELGRIIDDIAALASRLERYQVYNDPDSAEGMEAFKRMAQEIQARWVERFDEASSTYMPAKPRPVKGTNEYGGVVLDMKVKVDR